MWSLAILPVLITFVASQAVDPNCDFSQELQLGQTYNISNREYPLNYPAGTSCRWTVRNVNNRFSVSCSEINIPLTTNCAQDALTFNTTDINSSSARYYCGFGTLSGAESVGNTLIVTLTAAANSIGGRFFCTVTALSNNPNSTSCTCGAKNPARIVGGQQTAVNEYPWMARLVDLNSISTFCGATIISPKYLLTAAGCTVNRNSNSMLVVTGDHDITSSSDTTAATIHLISSITSHPQYQQSTGDYDIAVIRITDQILFTNRVGPVCLPFRTLNQNLNGLNVIALGWGSASATGPSSNVLQSVSLQAINAQNCRTRLPSATISDRQFCTQSQGKDTCQNDLGGPLLWQDPTSRRLVLVGIIGRINQCDTVTPTINTRVGGLLSWVVQQTPDAQYCQLQ